MGAIFISHSTFDNDEARRLRDWLHQQGWAKSQLFLDLDNIFAGERWRRQLNEQGVACDAVILCVSDNWLRSHECVREQTLAEAAGKLILPIVVKPLTERIPRFITDIQFANLNEPLTLETGLPALASALQHARIGPAHFPWPPQHDRTRMIYRGLRALDQDDAAIFFGREQSIRDGLEALRRMRGGAAGRVLAILGASGAGKSSFLKAGLLARLQQDTDNYVVLPVMRPEHAALTGPHGLLHSFGVSANVSMDALQDRFNAISARITEQIGIHTDSLEPNAPTFLLPIDQFEEIFAADQREADEALTLLASTLSTTNRLVVLLTIRADSYDRLQREPRLAAIPRLPFDLGPLSAAGFVQVIEGPAKVRNPPLDVEPALTDRLLQDLSTADGLPLLALTLEQLTVECGSSRKLRLQDYVKRLGGLHGALAKSVQGTMEAALRDPLLPDSIEAIEALARQMFIPWLVQIDEHDGVSKRRIALESEIPEPAHPLVTHFVNHRLVVADKSANGRTVEVAHEALFREWSTLRSWLADESQLLLTKSMINREFRIYSSAPPESKSEMLLTGTQYARALLVFNDRPGVLTAEEIGFIEDSRGAIEKVERYEKCRAQALERYVAPLLRQRVETLSKQVADLNRRIPSGYRETQIGLSDLKDLEAEVKLIENFVTSFGKWHPLSAEYDRCLGAEADYAEMYVFPCCGARVITGNEAPDQFRADGCEDAPSRIHQ